MAEQSRPSGYNKGLDMHTKQTSAFHQRCSSLPAQHLRSSAWPQELQVRFSPALRTLRFSVSTIRPSRPQQRHPKNLKVLKRNSCIKMTLKIREQGRCESVLIKSRHLRHLAQFFAPSNRWVLIFAQCLDQRALLLFRHG